MVNQTFDLGKVQGTDGFSPSAKVTQNETEITIIITDKDGTTTAVVPAGNLSVISENVNLCDMKAGVYLFVEEAGEIYMYYGLQGDSSTQIRPGNGAIVEISGSGTFTKNSPMQENFGKTARITPRITSSAYAQFGMPIYINTYFSWGAGGFAAFPHKGQTLNLKGEDVTPLDYYSAVAVNGMLPVIATAEKAGLVKAPLKTAEYTEQVKTDEEGNLWTKPGGGGGSYTLPVATEAALGGIKAAARTAEDTTEGRIGADGKIWIKPSATAAEKAAWNAKSDFSGSYNDLSNKPDLTKYLDKTTTAAQTLKGNLIGEYITCTWLQTTAATKNNALTEIAGISPDGWIYKMDRSALVKAATETALGGIKAAAKADSDTVECKIGADGKLYAGAVPTTGGVMTGALTVPELSVTDIVDISSSMSVYAPLFCFGGLGIATDEESTAAKIAVVGAGGAIKHITKKNLLGRDTNIPDADTAYADYMARGESLNAAEPAAPVNGAIAWVYE